jgi:molecular chaperone HtpG
VAVKKAFQAEVNQVLQLITHSMYSKPEVFIRELISNASDAIEKRSFLGLEDAKMLEGFEKGAIYVHVDDKAGTLSFSDNGIGMDADDLDLHLGTIAKSGTKAFINSLKQANSEQDKVSMIGQFGVGFYSAFVVADKVSVLTRKAGLSKSDAFLWESDGISNYEVNPSERDEVGTTVTLHLKEDHQEFLQDWQLRQNITKYSDHIRCGVFMEKIVHQEDQESTEKEVKYEQVNQGTALWMKDRKDIKKEEYESFYQHISNDFEPPADWIHKKVEGNYAYSMLLYLPKRAPFDLWHRDHSRGLKLYVQRVFIMDKVEQFLPNYLRFVRGVIDSNDLPLNVSREILQSNRVIDVIKQSATKHVLDLLDKKALDKEAYQEFWKQFGNVIKEGVGEDYQNQEKIQQLLRFSSTFDESGKQTQSLADYVSRMHEGQKDIFYVVADGYSSGMFSPHMEYFKKKGIEVLVLTDRIDEWMITRLSRFEEKNLVSITQSKLDHDDLKVDDQVKASMSDIIDRLKAYYKDRVKDVVLTKKLSQSPSCVVGENHEMTLHLRRILKDAGQPVPDFKPTLELNPDHIMVKALANEQSEDLFGLIADILFDQSIISEGGELSEPGRLVQNYNKWISIELEKKV